MGNAFLGIPDERKHRTCKVWMLNSRARCSLRPRLHGNRNHWMRRAGAARFLDDGCVRPSARMMHRCLRLHRAPETATRRGLRGRRARNCWQSRQNGGGCDDQTCNGFDKTPHTDDPSLAIPVAEVCDSNHTNLPRCVPRRNPTMTSALLWNSGLHSGLAHAEFQRDHSYSRAHVASCVAWSQFAFSATATTICSPCPDSIGSCAAADTFINRDAAATTAGT